MRKTLDNSAITFQDHDENHYIIESLDKDAQIENGTIATCILSTEQGQPNPAKKEAIFSNQKWFLKESLRKQAIKSSLKCWNTVIVNDQYPKDFFGQEITKEILKKLNLPGDYDEFQQYKTLYQLIKDGNEEKIIEFLKKNQGLDVKGFPPDKKSLLFLLAEKNLFSTINIIQERGYNFQNDKGYTKYNQDGTYVTFSALDKAAYKGFTKTVEALIAGGTNIDLKNNQEHTALHRAAYHGHNEVVQTLMAKGAAIDLKDKDGKTALHFAAMNGHNAVVQTLIGSGATIDSRDNNKRTVLQFAAYHGHDEVVQTLIDKGAAINLEDEDGNTALHLAAYQGHDEVVQTLVDKGATIDLQDKTGYTALHIAIIRGHNAVVQTLMAKGADIDLQNKNGRTALHFAAMNGHNAVVQTLIDHDASIDLPDKYGETALHFAAYDGHAAVAQKLIEKASQKGGSKAYVNLRNENGKTAFMIAAERNHEDLVTLLRSTMQQKDPRFSTQGDDRDEMVLLLVDDELVPLEEDQQQKNQTRPDPHKRKSSEEPEHQERLNSKKLKSSNFNSDESAFEQFTRKRKASGVEAGASYEQIKLAGPAGGSAAAGGRSF